MSSAEWFLALASVILLSGMGITLNACVVDFSRKNLKKGSSMNRSNQVHLTMGLVNILIQCMLTIQAVVWTSGSHIILMKDIYETINFINLSLIYLSYWLTSWLCAVYCINIANFTHQLFVWVKRRLSAFLPHLLLLTVVGSLTISLPSFWVIIWESDEGTFVNDTLGSAQSTGRIGYSVAYTMFFIGLGCCLPIGVTLLSIGLTIGSLLQHIRNMRQNDTDFDQSKLRVHSDAIKTMVLHLILALSFYIAEMFCFRYDTIAVNAKTAIGFLCVLLYPTAQSAIIFQSSSKLRMVLGNIFSPCRRITVTISE